MMKLFLFIALVCAKLSSAEAIKPFFQASQKQPYHLSVGAVLFNAEGKVACHHFKEILGHKDIYILMRESMENDETPLETLHRGLKEEFGATAEPIVFLGCLSGPVSDPSLAFEKTTLYISCKLIQMGERDSADPESSSDIEWLEPDTLISILQKQGARFQHRVDADESEMIRRAVSCFKNKDESR